MIQQNFTIATFRRTLYQWWIQGGTGETPPPPPVKKGGRRKKKKGEKVGGKKTGGPGKRKKREERKRKNNPPFPPFLRGGGGRGTCPCAPWIRHWYSCIDVQFSAFWYFMIIADKMQLSGDFDRFWDRNLHIKIYANVWRH